MEGITRKVQLHAFTLGESWTGKRIGLTVNVTLDDTLNVASIIEDSRFAYRRRVHALIAQLSKVLLFAILGWHAHTRLDSERKRSDTGMVNARRNLCKRRDTANWERSNGWKGWNERDSFNRSDPIRVGRETATPVQIFRPLYSPEFLISLHPWPYPIFNTRD